MIQKKNIDVLIIFEMKLEIEIKGQFTYVTNQGKTTKHKTAFLNASKHNFIQNMHYLNESKGVDV